MAVTSSRAGHRSPETPAAGSPRRHLPGSFAGERRPRLSLFPPESIFPPKSFKWPRKCRRPSRGCPHGAVTTGQCPASRVRSQPRFLPVVTDHVSSLIRSRGRHVPEGDGPWLFRCTIIRCRRTGGKGLCEAHVCRPALGPTCASAMCHGRWLLLGSGPRKPGPRSRASDPCAGPRVCGPASASPLSSAGRHRPRRLLALGAGPFCARRTELGTVTGRAGGSPAHSPDGPRLPGVTSSHRSVGTCDV